MSGPLTSEVPKIPKQGHTDLAIRESQVLSEGSTQIS